VLPLAHIGLYGFSAATLQKFARLPETDLERAEGLEQLRALWHGIPIDVGVVRFKSIAVDTLEDLEKVRMQWRDV
jgi:3-deoxy-manno-octulosonate cytidylyltransferase (CMP-KDO synthetase)